MDYSVLEKSVLFSGVPAKELRDDLESVPHHIQCYDKDLRIMKNFMTELATATYMLQQRLELLSYSGIVQKAAFYLLIQARQSGKNVIRIPDSVSNWAMVMNVSRSSLHRELKKLETDGIITYDPPTIEIHDPEALQKVLSK